MLTLGVLISGRGTNLQSLVDACALPDFPARIGLVISNKEKAAGLARAQRANIPTKVVRHKDFETRESFEREMTRHLKAHEVDFICNAGFMRILTSTFIDAWFNRQLNIHPSLLPSFKGLNVHEAAIESGVRISGCSIHYMRAQLDAGPIVAQAAVPVLTDDTAEKLAARVLTAEHALYPKVVRFIAEGKISIDGDVVHYDGLNDTDQSILLSP